MEQGIVKWFSPDKGYGFIAGADGVDTFVHYTGIKGTGVRNLVVGQRVSFDLAENAKGTVAVNVQVL
jgi:CspA family cold shock protein